jgi:putative Mg2+ transporter-C (MgtC) family protein
VKAKGSIRPKTFERIDFMSEIWTAAAIFARLATALAAGAAIGAERQWHQKMAGLRTNALVALGAGGFVAFSSVSGHDDPTRIAAQVVSGIGFLGAGIILREGINVRGLNTAATLWCSAMAGTFAGGGFYVLSLGAAAFVVAVNVAMRPLVLRLNRQSRSAAGEGEARYTISVTCRGAEEAHVRSLLLHALSQAGLGLRRIESEDLADIAKVCVTAETAPGPRKDAALEQIVGRMSLEHFVTAVSWEASRDNADV